MRTQPTISVRYAHRILERAASRGVLAESLGPAAQLHPVERNGDSRITGEAYLRLWRVVMERIKDPGFPLEVAASTGIETYDIFGFVCMTSADFGEALSRASRYLRIWTDLARWELTVQGATAQLRLVPAVQVTGQHGYGSQCALAEMLGTSRGYLGTHWIPREVHLDCRKPADAGPLEQFFGAAIRFDRPFSALLFDAALLSKPLLKADPAISAFFQRHADELLKGSPEVTALASDVRRRVAQSMGNGTPTLDTIARTLAMSSRTLRRRLQEEGHTFGQILQEARCALARQHLEEATLSLGEIAFLLGFSDVSAFHRSFRRWTGQTPSEFRRDGGSIRRAVGRRRA